MITVNPGFVTVAAWKIFPPAGFEMSVPVVFLRDHQVLLVLHPGGATGGAVGVGVRTDIYPVHPGSDGRHRGQRIASQE